MGLRSNSLIATEATHTEAEMAIRCYVGDAMVYAKHANIIVNAGHASAREVLELTAIMKARVRERFGVELEEEVMFLGEKPRLGGLAGRQGA